ncbi:MAG: lactate racemase domain-containing protein [Sedimentisphaerales bacterium]|jgi:nickel-dependent lactate racemase|nr:lactate racemase domain-containing protein [Sedimentisphaerales bacterium]
MKVDLHYGTGVVGLRVPDRNVQEIIRPWQGEQTGDAAAGLQEAMDGQAGAFRDKIAGKRACVLVDDGTRDEPLGYVLPHLCNVLRPAVSVQFLICTGTHTAATPKNEQIRREIEKASRDAGLTVVRIHTHDCQVDTFIDVGRTSRGTQVSVNAFAEEADVFLVVADVKVHYFAGYSNPVKNFVPGISAFRTVEQNHSLALLDESTHAAHPWHPRAEQRNNPLAADMVEGMDLIAKGRPIYALVMLSAGTRLLWARFGPIREVSAESFLVTDERNIQTVAPASRLVISPGGLANDEDLYIAQRALELNRAAVMDGGEILFLAACPNGIGEPQTLANFYDRLTAPLEEVIQSIQQEYVLYSHKPYKFAVLIRRLRRVWMHTQIADALVEAAHMHPAHDPQAVVDGWIAEQPDVRIIFIDGANKVALRAVS